METRQVAILIGALVTFAIGLLLWGVLRLLRSESPQQRLERLSSSPRPLEDLELEKPFQERVIGPWLQAQVRAAGRLAPGANVERVRVNLMRAGYPRNLTVLDFLGLKILVALMSGIVTAFLFAPRAPDPLRRLLLPAVMIVFGFFLPDFWLNSRVRQRQSEILRQLPDALDMLTICVDAGAGLESALLRISQKAQNAIGGEFGKVVAEMRLGITRREAFQNMAFRTDVPEVGSFVAVLLQADQFGLSIANVLHTQSDQMRERRWQRAEEEARKIPIKLLFPLVFLIMPSLFAVTIGPAVPVLIDVFGGLMGQ
jgi:tight adherence protein C